MTTDKTTQKLEAKGFPIRAVTVYNNRARIERVLSLDLPVRIIQIDFSSIKRTVPTTPNLSLKCNLSNSLGWHQ
jgi:hypothetical protein